jgi:hypothetical protein
MNDEALTQRLLAQMEAWYDAQRPAPGEEPKQNVVCAGLAVLEVARTASFPLSQTDYVTEKNQVRCTGGPAIRRILARYGETRTYLKEGGRTTRSTRAVADQLVARLNTVAELAALSTAELNLMLDQLQSWLVERVRDYFNRQRLEVEISLERPGPQVIEDILDAAHRRGSAGPVAQHIVGAKLSLRFEEQNVIVDNYSYTTADDQLGRPGDFMIGDTVFHVTVAPMPSVIEKCRDNLRAGYRPYLLVPQARLAGARDMADTLQLKDRVAIQPIHEFVGQNIEEMGGFHRSGLKSRLRSLLERYNERVAAAETDRSLLIEIPANL